MCCTAYLELPDGPELLDVSACTEDDAIRSVIPQLREQIADACSDKDSICSAFFKSGIGGQIDHQTRSHANDAQLRKHSHAQSRWHKMLT